MKHSTSGAFGSSGGGLALNNKKLLVTKSKQVRILRRYLKLMRDQFKFNLSV